MNQEQATQESIYSAYQNKQHKLCYSLETSNSMRILRCIKKGISISEVCEDNLQNLNSTIDRIDISKDDYYETKVKDRKEQTLSFQQILHQFQRRVVQMQNIAQMRLEQNSSDSNGDWVPDFEEEEEESDSFQYQ
ncbi:unnamed protein product [Paramecium octaurelia]|uniref:Uncharacterized protein n=1 Tax=Paramecium octaurelia TaxID=43137 RepID=A0A8S1SWJ6_PAROT|nr:unnamed protein product [Paramecium octaurelia]